MNQLDRLERDLTVWFAETAAPRTPPYFDDILQLTAGLRQRPRWTFLERLIPMTATASFRAMTPRVPWRTIGVVVVLLIALLIGAIFVGSAQRRLPAPFGRAAPGLVAYSSDGDIFVVDPATNERHSIVTGPEVDLDPQWSRDGTRIVFRRGEGIPAELYTVRPDGSQLTLITPTGASIMPHVASPDYAFSPDGRSVLFMSWSPAQISIAQTDGSGVRTIQIEGFHASEAAFRPPDGRQIGVIGDGRGVYLVDAITGDVDTLVEPLTPMLDESLTWSPDGTQLAYHRWDPTAPVFTVRGHVLDVASRTDRLADPSRTAPWDGQATFSNDGRRIAIVRGYAEAGYSDMTLAILWVDGSGAPVETAHHAGLMESYAPTFEWAPDDSSILWTPVDASVQRLPQLRIDPDTGAVTAAPWNAASDPAWQRLAP